MALHGAKNNPVLSHVNVLAQSFNLICRPAHNIGSREWFDQCLGFSGTTEFAFSALNRVVSCKFNALKTTLMPDDILDGKQAKKAVAASAMLSLDESLHIGGSASYITHEKVGGLGFMLGVFKTF